VQGPRYSAAGTGIQRIREAEDPEKELKVVERELFQLLCLKEHLYECEPGYCGIRLVDSRPYVHVITRLSQELQE